MQSPLHSFTYRAREGPLCGRRADSIEPRSERLARDPLVGFEVALAGARDNLVGARRRRRVLVPARARRPVARELLVEARLPAAGLVIVGPPESRGMPRGHFGGPP